MPKCLAVAVLTVAAAPFAACALPDERPPVQTGFVDKTIDVDGETRRYVVYVPEAYRGARSWPVVVFLNGRGECGTDGKKQAEVGLGAAIRAEPERWPYVVVFPQKPDMQSQWADHEALVFATLEATEREYSCDPERRFLTGLSQGGSGAWSIGAAHPDHWTAVAPVCGYRWGDVDVARLRETPVWAFHGDADRAVPVTQTKELCAELRAAGGEPRMTIYDGVGHNSWDRAYGESGLAEWFLAVAEAR